MQEVILIRIEGADAGQVLAELNAWLETEGGFRLTPVPAAHPTGVRSSEGKGRLARAEQVLGLAGNAASVVALLMAFTPPVGNPEPSPPRSFGAAEHEQLVDGAARLLDKLKELGCEREIDVDLIGSESGTNLRLRLDTAPAEVVGLCLQTRPEN